MSNLAPRYLPYTAGVDNDVSEVTIPFPAPPPPPPPPSLAQPSRTGFNYRRDPALMMSPAEGAPALATQTTAHATPAAAVAPATNAVDAPPAAMAVPYIALHNVGWKATNFTGRKWVILPMVAGFESTFIANTLQGLLCLPGCESAMMGDPAPASTATDAGATEDAKLGLAKELGSAQLRLTRTGSPTGAASPVPATTAAAAVEEEGEELDDAEPQEDDLDDDEEPCQDEAAALSGDDHSDGGAEDAHHGSGGSASGGRGRGGHAMPVLRGGIRCQWGTRVKTAASRTYTSYVMQNLSDAGIQLRKPAPRTGLTVEAVVPFSEVDDAEELESLRGQSAVVPRSLAPVALPTAPKPAAICAAAITNAMRVRGHVAVYLAQPDDAAGPTQGGARAGAAGTAHAGGGASSSGSGQSSAAPAPSSSVVAASPATSGGATGASAVANAASAGSTTSAALQDAKKAAAVQLVASEGHSSDDDNNSPTPSSREEEEEEETVWVSADGAAAADRASGVAATAAAARVAHRPVTTDASRYTCLASNCVDNMPNYPLPQLQSEDLVDLASFMVARSTLQPDEAVDLQLGTHVLGDPRAVQQLPAEQRAALMQRAARLMEAAVFLQV